MQAGAELPEEPVRRRDHPVVAALAPHHHQPPAGHLHIRQPQPQRLTPAQPHQQHAQHQRPVPVRAQRTHQPVGFPGDKIRGRVRGTRTSGTARDLFVPPWRRVSSPRGTGLTRTGVSPRATR
jgi:hypothetical protein